MRRLSLKGFLLQYCKLLAELDTRSYALLARRAENGWSRVTEPLVLLSLVEGKTALLEKRAGGEVLECLRAALDALGEEEGGPVSEEVLLRSKDALPESLRKVLASYEAQAGRTSNDRRLTALVREPLLALMEDKGLTGYRLCKDLCLNSGNVYAYLANGNVKCVSKATALRMLDYAKSY